jgi:NADPH:quinone reductase
MRAIEIEAYGGPETMKVVERRSPSPGRREALVRVAAAGVNFIDVYHRTGLYPQRLPLRLGLEGAGTVIARGDEASEVEVGDRVAWASGPGSYATEVTVASDRLVKVPDGVSLDAAAAAMLQGLTAHYLVHSTYPLAKGERCLVHAAAGGVGLLLIQLATRIGAEVIGTVSTEEKAALARAAGAKHVILYREKDFVQEVDRITNGQKVSVVYDSVGKTTFEKSFDCLRPRGMLVLYGQSSGPVSAFDPQLLNAKGALFLTRPTLHHYVATRAELVERTSAIFDAILRKDLSVRIQKTYPLEGASSAHRDLEARVTSGKLLLAP